MAVLCLRGLRLELEGRVLLRDIDLELEEGELCLLVGRSGAGKSLLLRALVGLAPGRRSGELRWRGGGEPQAGELALVPQEGRPALDPLWRVGEQLGALGPRAQWATWWERLGLAAELLDRRPQELSGGQARRVLMVAALCQGARVLLIDEPGVGLDAQGRAELAGALEELRRDGVGLLCAVHPRPGRQGPRELGLAEGRPCAPERLQWPTAAPPPPIGGPLLRLEGAGAPPRLPAVELDLGRGERLLILGRSGAGKTSLCRLAAGLLAPAQGGLQRWLPPPGLAGGLQLLYQDASAHLHARAPVSHLLSTTARIWNSAADLPGLLEGMALSALWSREAGSLSGGEQRRVALARAALTRPGLLLADEPTAGLDPLQGWHCLELLLGALAPEGGALICSHDREGVEPLCHRALELGPSGLGPPSAPLSAGWL